MMKSKKISMYLLFSFIGMSNSGWSHYHPNDHKDPDDHCFFDCTAKRCSEDKQDWDMCFQECNISERIKLIPHCAKAAAKAGYINKF